MKNIPVLIALTLILLGCSQQSLHVHPDLFHNIDVKTTRPVVSVSSVAYNEKKALVAIGYEMAKNPKHYKQGTLKGMQFHPKSSILNKFSFMGQVGKVDIYDGLNASKYMTIFPEPSIVNNLNFSKDGKYLSMDTYSGSSTKIYNLESKSVYATLDNTRGTEIFTANSKYVILANSREIKIYDLEEKIWRGSYKTDGTVDALAFNDDETLLAVTLSGKIQLFSFKQPSWFSRIYCKEPPSLSLLKSVGVAYTPRDEIEYLWFANDALVTLSRFAHLDIWSIPNLTKIKNISIHSKVVSDAILLDNQRYIIATAVNRNRKEGKFFVEQIDLENNTSIILSSVRTNIPNIVQCPILESTDENKFIFIEQAGTKMLLRTGPVPKNIATNYFASISKYLSKPYFYKAMSVAKGVNGKYAFYSTWGRANQKIANQIALEKCQKDAQLKNLHMHCSLMFEGDTQSKNVNISFQN